MKIVSDVLTSIEGIQIFYIIGLLIFITLFIVITVRTMRIPNSEMNRIKTSILSDDEQENPVNIN